MVDLTSERLDRDLTPMIFGRDCVGLLTHHHIGDDLRCNGE